MGLPPLNAWHALVITNVRSYRGPLNLRLPYQFGIIRAASRENLSSGFLTRPDTNRAVQTRKVVRGWSLGLVHYLCSENKGNDLRTAQLIY